jgi:hypothetical protein
VRDEERKLRGIIRFLPSPIINGFFIIGFAIMGEDFLAIHNRSAVLAIILYESAFVCMILIRWRCQVQLKRLLAKSGKSA